MKLTRVERGVYRFKQFRVEFVEPAVWLVYDESRCPHDFATIVFNSRSLKVVKAWITKHINISSQSALAQANLRIIRKLKMKKLIVLLAVFISIIATTWAMTFEYECPECGLRLRYSKVGAYRCPANPTSDYYMIPKPSLNTVDWF